MMGPRRLAAVAAGITLLATSVIGTVPGSAHAQKGAKAVKRAKLADNARRVGGLRASKRPRPGYLLALGKDGKFPASVLPASVGGLVPSLNPTAPPPSAPAYAAGFGLKLQAPTFSVDPAVIQRRLTGNCAVGKALVGIGEDGVPSCGDVVTRVEAGAGLAAATTDGVARLDLAPPIELHAPTSFVPLYVSNSGEGGALRADTDTTGKGSAISGQNFGTDRYGGEFELHNVSNPRAAIYARTAGTGQAIDAEVNSNTTADAIFARTTSPQAGSFAGVFSGNVQIAGTLTKTAGSFRIDHPLDPARKYLSHSFVESPDMKNLYDGVVTTDDGGFATVRLPDWFDALNRDFRYVLTPIRSFSRATVWEEIAGNAFVIRTEDPGVRVSWQVTGIRDDAYARRHPIPVEEDKTDAEVGRYLNPDAFGKPADRAIARPGG